MGEARAVEALSPQEFPGRQGFAAGQLQLENTQDARAADHVYTCARCREH
jgi:hypothetical protein